MFYKGRELRRLWRVRTYEGDREDPDVKIRDETLIAWNAVEAIRVSGGLAASQPVAVCFVTWPDADEKVYRINNTSGPTDEVIEPSIETVDPTVDRK